jgi:hypothetical protein
MRNARQVTHNILLILLRNTSIGCPHIEDTRTGIELA